MERLFILAPALIPAAYLIGAFVVFSALCVVGRRPRGSETRKHSRFFYFFIDYFLWILRPIERATVALHLTPNQLTFAALAACASAGLAIGTGHMATAGWLYIISGALDILDGRLARATNQQTKAGALLDSISDRWAELFVFTGFAWFLHDSLWLLAVMLAAAGSVMVSYTRARGEALGIKLDFGAMQRAERITLVSIGTLITAWFDAGSDTAEYGAHVIGVCLLIVGVGSTITALRRWVHGYRELAAEDRGESKPAETGEHKLVTR